MTGPAMAAHGVRSFSEDGTPSALDPETSAEALDALEFDIALEVVAEYAVGPLGAEAIRTRLPSHDADWIRFELAHVGELLALLRRGESIAVPAVPPLRGALGRLRVEGSVLELGELVDVATTLSAGRVLGNELERLAEACPRLAGLRVPPADRALERLLERSLGDDGQLLDSASPALAAARREVHAARERLIRRLDVLLREMDSAAIPGGATVTMRSGRYVIPVRRDARSRPEGIIHDESGSAGTLFIEPSAAIELGNAVRAAVIAEERETLKVLRDLTEALRPVRDTIRALHTVAVEVDTIAARARWALQTGGEVPEIAPPGGTLSLRQARHPLLLARGIDVVPFDLVLDSGERTLLISGPNTGGKTVLLKATGLLLALSQSGAQKDSRACRQGDAGDSRRGRLGDRSGRRRSTRDGGAGDAHRPWDADAGHHAPRDTQEPRLARAWRGQRLAAVRCRHAVADLPIHQGDPGAFIRPGHRPAARRGPGGTGAGGGAGSGGRAGARSPARGGRGAGTGAGARASRAGSARG